MLQEAPKTRKRCDVCQQAIPKNAQRCPGCGNTMNTTMDPRDAVVSRKIAKTGVLKANELPDNHPLAIVEAAFYAAAAAHLSEGRGHPISRTFAELGKNPKLRSQLLQRLAKTRSKRLKAMHPEDRKVLHKEVSRHATGSSKAGKAAGRLTKRLETMTEAQMLERVYQHRVERMPSHEIAHQGRHVHAASGAHVRLRPYMTRREKAIWRLYRSKGGRVARRHVNDLRHMWNIIKDPKTPRSKKVHIALSGLAGLSTFVSPIPGDEIIGAALIHHALHVASGKPSTPISTHFMHALSAFGPQVNWQPLSPAQREERVMAAHRPRRRHFGEAATKKPLTYAQHAERKAAAIKSAAARRRLAALKPPKPESEPLWKQRDVAEQWRRAALRRKARTAKRAAMRDRYVIRPVGKQHSVHDTLLDREVGRHSKLSDAEAQRAPLVDAWRQKVRRAADLPRVPVAPIGATQPAALRAPVEPPAPHEAKRPRRGHVGYGELESGERYYTVHVAGQGASAKVHRTRSRREAQELLEENPARLGMEHVKDVPGAHRRLEPRPGKRQGPSEQIAPGPAGDWAQVPGVSVERFGQQQGQLAAGLRPRKGPPEPSSLRFLTRTIKPQDVPTLNPGDQVRIPSGHGTIIEQRSRSALVADNQGGFQTVAHKDITHARRARTKDEARQRVLGHAARAQAVLNSHKDELARHVSRIKGMQDAREKARDRETEIRDAKASVRAIDRETEATKQRLADARKRTREAKRAGKPTASAERTSAKHEKRLAELHEQRRGVAATASMTTQREISRRRLLDQGVEDTELSRRETLGRIAGARANVKATAGAAAALGAREGPDPKVAARVEAERLDKKVADLQAAADKSKLAVNDARQRWQSAGLDDKEAARQHLGTQLKAHTANVDALDQAHREHRAKFPDRVSARAGERHMVPGPVPEPYVPPAPEPPAPPPEPPKRMQYMIPPSHRTPLLAAIDADRTAKPHDRLVNDLGRPEWFRSPTWALRKEDKKRKVTVRSQGKSTKVEVKHNWPGFKSDHSGRDLWWTGGHQSKARLDTTVGGEIEDRGHSLDPPKLTIPAHNTPTPLPHPDAVRGYRDELRNPNAGRLLVGGGEVSPHEDPDPFNEAHPKHLRPGDQIGFMPDENTGGAPWSTETIRKKVASTAQPELRRHVARTTTVAGTRTSTEGNVSKQGIVLGHEPGKVRVFVPADNREYSVPHEHIHHVKHGDVNDREAWATAEKGTILEAELTEAWHPRGTPSFPDWKTAAPGTRVRHVRSKRTGTLRRVVNADKRQRGGNQLAVIQWDHDAIGRHVGPGMGVSGRVVAPAFDLERLGEAQLLEAWAHHRGRRLKKAGKRGHIRVHELPSGTGAPGRELAAFHHVDDLVNFLHQGPQGHTPHIAVQIHGTGFGPTGRALTRREQADLVRRLGEPTQESNAGYALGQLAQGAANTFVPGYNTLPLDQQQHMATLVTHHAGFAVHTVRAKLPAMRNPFTHHPAPKIADTGGFLSQ